MKREYLGWIVAAILVAVFVAAGATGVAVNTGHFQIHSVPLVLSPTAQNQPKALEIDLPVLLDTQTGEVRSFVVEPNKPMALSKPWPTAD
jgi:hypothetical protein